MRPYSELNGFAELYLEDSYVLGLEQSSHRLLFLIEAVLRENHPRYRSPERNEQYCYAKIRVGFEYAEIRWAEMRFIPTVDPDGAADFGNIDEFTTDNQGTYIISGDWGHVTICSQQPTIEYLD